MSDQVIQFFNRYSGRMETEHIYGERWLRWAYQTSLGRLTTRTIASKVWFSRWYGWRMSKPSSARLIKPFMQKYAINADEMASQPEAFKSFNEFFFRHLKSAARPIAPESEAVIFPADGRHLGFNDYSAAKRFFIKGEQFDLVSLLGGAADAAELKGASVVLSRLCPVDYHRFHFPLECTPGQTELIPGPLYSVSPIALVRDISILARNRRAVTVLQTPAGRCWQVEIGATNVGSIQQTYTPQSAVRKGAEKGYFAFGGSAVMTIFPKNTLILADDLVRNSASGIETYARMGDTMGHLCTTPDV